MADFSLAADEKSLLLGIARSTIESYVQKRTIPTLNQNSMSEALKTGCGAFVTLKKQGQLRGCIGRFDSSEPLYRVVQSMAVAAATQDYRFAPVQLAEMRTIEVEISVLTPLQRIQNLDELVLGRHGIYIKKKMNSGTFLPQVATETGWTKEEFVGHCAEEKMGIGYTGWKDADAELFTYEALVFSER
ncbi:MAG: AmmeMemoRadiSam system protein A [Ignavibacteriales bacterium]|nr:AmmeMemoRadiSam system protein A [Ignavibacteriales bacterium]